MGLVLRWSKSAALTRAVCAALGVYLLFDVAQFGLGIDQDQWAPAPPSPGALCQGGDPEGPSLPRLSASPRFAIGGVQFGVGLDPRRSHLFEAERRSGQMGLGINNGQADQGCKGDCEERCGEGNRLGVHGGFVCPAG